MPVAVVVHVAVVGEALSREVDGEVASVRQRNGRSAWLPFACVQVPGPKALCLRSWTCDTPWRIRHAGAPCHNFMIAEVGGPGMDA